MSSSDATARSYLYTGGVLTNHVITHNLNSRWITYTAYVTATGIELVPGVDIAVVTASNPNQFSLELNDPTAITVRVTT